MAKETITELDDTNDFGFTFHNAEEIVTDDLEGLKIRLKTIRTTYLPLLEHLSKDPDKPMIKWPNRKNILDKQIKKLIELTEV